MARAPPRGHRRGAHASATGPPSSTTTSFPTTARVGRLGHWTIAGIPKAAMAVHSKRGAPIYEQALRHSRLRVRRHVVGRPQGRVLGQRRWFATFKNELIYTRAWPTLAGLHPAVFEYIEGWYNTRAGSTAAWTTAARPSTKR